VRTTCGKARYSATAPTEGDVLCFPNLSRATGAKIGVIYAHGGSNTFDQMFDPTLLYYPGIDKLVTHGQYPLVFADMGGGTWGNATMAGTNANDTCRMLEAYNWLQNASGGGAKSGKVHLIGVSQGGVGVVNWAKRNPTLVQSISLVVPALDLQDIYVNDRGGNQANINTAYGGVPDYATRSPMNLAANLAGIPTRVWYATNDTVTPSTATNTTFATSVGVSGSTVSMGAVGHTVSVDVNQLLTFVAANS